MSKKSILNYKYLWESCHFYFLKVHKLDPEQWKKVEVVHIDIADRSQVDAKVRKTEYLLSMHDQTLRLADSLNVFTGLQTRRGSSHV